LLQRFTHFTAVPKFTCKIRTSLSNLFELFPQLSISHATANPSVVTDASLEGQNQNIPASRLNRPNFQRSVDNIRQVVDIIEPHHIRRFVPSLSFGSPFWLSYGFSVVRWRKEILFIQPNLEHDITVIENHYHVILCSILKRIDTKHLYTKEFRPASTLLLNTIYEVVRSLKFRRAVNHAAITGYLDELTDRISHLYCVLFPVKNDMKRHERETYDSLAQVLACFTKTSVLLPPELRNLTTPMNDNLVRTAQEVAPLQCPHQHISVLPQSTLFPCLEEYIPAQFLTIFGFDASFFCREDLVTVEEYSMFYDAERMLRDGFCIDGAIIPHVLSIAPCALSIATEIILPCYKQETSQTSRRHIAQMIVAQSVLLCFNFFYQLIDNEKLDAWLNTWPHVSASMYTWAEDNGIVLLKRDHLQQRTRGT
jgi:hypothetical protein